MAKKVVRSLKLNKMNKYIWMVLAGFAVHIINVYFLELEILQTVSVILFLWGVLGDILSNVTWQKKTSISVRSEEMREVIKSL